MQKRDYKFISLIGSGSFAKVYLAVNSQQQQFAIKVISIDLNDSQSDKQIQYFEQEIQIYKNVQNENVVCLIEEFREDKEIYCVFEFCSNGDLNNFLKNSILNEDEIKSIFIEILKGMKYIHQKQIVHRDLKIDNILIDENKVVKIADFGFAKYYNDNAILTSYCGTPATMAPEILNQQNYDYKCDIWSLGVILYYMIYRKYHFSNKVKSLMDLIKELQNFQIKFDDFIFKLSDNGKDLLSKMLDSNQNTRIDYENLFAHPWLQGALMDEDNMRISKIIINQQFINQESKLIGRIIRNFRHQKQEFLAIVKKLQEQCKDETVKQQITEFYDKIHKAEQHIHFQCQSILHQQIVPIIDYKVESYQILYHIYQRIKFNHLDLFAIESELIDFLNASPLSNCMTIKLKQQYNQEELDNIQQKISEINVDDNNEDLSHYFNLQTIEIDPQIKQSVDIYHLQRKITLKGMEIQYQHKLKIDKPAIDLQF